MTVAASTRRLLLISFASIGLASLAPAQVELARLSPAGASASDKNAWSASSDGLRVLVGNRFEDPGGVQDEGSATIFEQVGGVWQQSATLVAMTGAAFDEFGWDVLIDGDLAFVSAPEDDDGGFGSGSVYVFEFDGSVWIETQKLAPSVHTFGDVFGVSLSFDADRLVVGACQMTAFETLGIGRGRAFVFERQGNLFVETAILIALDGRDGDQFGNSVHLDADSVLISAERDRDTVADGGSVYSFELEPGGWQQKQEFRPSSAEVGDFFARRGGRDGDLFVAGTEFRDVGGVPDAGAAFVFERDPISGLWGEIQVLSFGPGFPNTRFGTECAVQGDLIAVGAPGPDGSSQSLGMSVLFDASVGYAEVARFSSSSAAAGDNFGHGLAFGGDLFVATAPSDPTGGAAFVYDVRRATVAVRDAGSNPSSLRANTPVVGKTISYSVDLALSGHALAGLVGFLSPLTFTLGSGQVLLVNPADPAGELFGLSLTAGPQAQFMLALPLDVGLLGLNVSAQALHFGAVSPFALSNALDLVIGAL